jgi:hypothetical protein
MLKGLTLIAPVIWVFCAGMVHADNGWEAAILVSAGDAEHRLSLGVRRDALDGTDGRHDVPALFTDENDFRTYISLEGMPYWRDIKADCSQKSCFKTWDIFVEFLPEGGPVRFIWDPGSFPKQSDVFLTDAVTGGRMDMKKQSGYSFEEGGKRLFRVEVQDETGKRMVAAARCVPGNAHVRRRARGGTPAAPAANSLSQRDSALMGLWKRQ